MSDQPQPNKQPPCASKMHQYQRCLGSYLMELQVPFDIRQRLQSQAAERGKRIHKALEEQSQPPDK